MKTFDSSENTSENIEGFFRWRPGRLIWYNRSVDRERERKELEDVE